MDIEDLDDNAALASSDSATLDAAAGGADSAADADAGSSTATDENDEGLLGVVRDVVSARKEPDAAASSADGAEAGSAADGTQPTGPDNENYSDVPFHKHPRFQALIADRNALREDAGRYQNVLGYLEQNNLSSDEAANALGTFARAKVDPAGAFAELKPWLQDLLVRAGEVLSDDLQSRVASGELSAEAAQEISRERAKSKSHESRQTFEQQRQERQTQTNLATELVSTADAWAKDRRVKDPNFAAKEPLLMREIAFIQSTEGKPKDAAGVRKQLQDAYEAVNKSFKPPAAVTPPTRKPATRPVTGGTVTGTVREKPQTTLDIVRANRRSA